MEKISRKIMQKGREVFNLKRIGFSSEGTLTLICVDDTLDYADEPTEVLFNFNKEELKKLKEFLWRIE